jgi:hypothetical protein
VMTAGNGFTSPAEHVALMLRWHDAVGDLA